MTKDSKSFERVDRPHASLQTTRADWAKEWKFDLKSFRSDMFNSACDPETAKPVKIAVIDTGAYFRPRDTIHKYQDRIKGFWKHEPRNIVEGQRFKFPNDSDSDGHGTNVTSVLLGLDEHCHVYVYNAYHHHSEASGTTMASKNETSIREVGCKLLATAVDDIG